MKGDNIYSEQIDRFLHNKMTNEEMQMFKQQVESDSKLKQQVREHLLLIQAIRETQAEKDKAIIDSVTLSTTSTTTKHLRPIRYWSIAASIALLFVAGHDVYYHLMSNQLMNDLSAQIEEQYQNVSIRGVEDEDIVSLRELFANVDKKENLDYTIASLSTLYDISKDEYVDAIDDFSSQIGIELAIACYRNGERRKAIDILDTIIKEYPDNKDAIRLRKYLIGSFLYMQ